MGATGVCDDRGMFTFFSTGYLGRTHDSAAYKACDLYLHEDEYFSGEDWLFADAAYALSMRIIPRYKAAHLTQQQKRFNELHARARVKIEHAFGMLKGKFLSLTELRCNILDDDGIWKTAEAVIACVVLHNITRLPELYDPHDEQIPLIPIVRQENRVQGVDRGAAVTKRDNIMAQVLQRLSCAL
jgi:hypothetical protein